MRKIILLLLFPVVINAQNNYNNWISPVADIEFDNGKIISYFLVGTQLFYDRIVPMSYSRDILLMCPVFIKVNIEQKAIADLKSSVNYYLSNVSVIHSDERDKNTFIKYCCLQIILSRKNLPENALNTLNILKKDMSSSTSENATLALKLYNSFVQQKRYPLQYKTDTINNNIATNIPSNFISIPQNRWEVYLGHPNRTDYTNDLIETYDRGYILAGGYKGVDGMIMKTDINGSLLYEKDYQYNNEMVVIAAIQDSSGNTYQCGLLVVYGTISWPYLAKFDSCGNKVWCNVYYNPQEHMGGWAKDIVFGNEGELIVLTHLNEEGQNRQIFLFAYDTDGNNLWKKAYATHDDHPLIAAAGAYHLLEDHKEFFISGFCYWPFPGGDTNHVFLRPFFIGIDSNYNEKWILPFAVEDSLFGDAFSSIRINDTLFMGVGYIIDNNNMNQSILMFYSPDGDEIGYSLIENESIGNNVYFNSIGHVVSINDSIFLSPCYVGIDGNERHFGEFIYNTDGDLKNYSIRGIYSSSSSVIKTHSGNYVIAVEVDKGKANRDILFYKIDKNLESVPFDTNQYTYDSLCPYPITSETIDLSDCLLWTDTEEITTPEEYYGKLKTIPVKAFPNPAKDKITIALENTDKHRNIQLECYDIFGRQMHKQTIYTGQLEAETDVTGWGKGLYFVVVKSNGKIVGKGKFVVK